MEASVCNQERGTKWRHFLHQPLPHSSVQTRQKYNKHHHDLKNQVCRYMNMYIKNNFWVTAPCQGCPEKRDIHQLVSGVLPCSARFLSRVCLSLLYNLLHSNATLVNVTNSDWRRDKLCCRLRSFSVFFYRLNLKCLIWLPIFKIFLCWFDISLINFYVRSWKKYRF